jgi:hypothetical protein
MNKLPQIKMNKQWDLVALSIMFLLAFTISWKIEANMFVSTLLFFGTTSYYLSLRRKDLVKKTLKFALLFAFPLGALVDLIASVNRAWYVTNTMFPLRIYQTIPIEDLIWAFLVIYLVVIFYEHIFDTQVNSINNRWKPFLTSVFIILIITTIIYYLKEELLEIPYAYMTIGLIGIMFPIIIFMVNFRKFFKPFLLTSAYFFVPFALFVALGLELSQWIYIDGEYIKVLIIWGHNFPAEVLIYWFILLSVAILTYYEYLFDDTN